MTCVYEVRYEVQWETPETAQWEPRAVKVAAGPDAQEAVDKAKTAALAEKSLDENGVERKCAAFRLRGVALVAEAEL